MQYELIENKTTLDVFSLGIICGRSGRFKTRCWFWIKRNDDDEHFFPSRQTHYACMKCKWSLSVERMCLPQLLHIYGPSSEIKNLQKNSTTWLIRDNLANIFFYIYIVSLITREWFNLLLLYPTASSQDLN